MEQALHQDLEVTEWDTQDWATQAWVTVASDILDTDMEWVAGD